MNPIWGHLAGVITLLLMLIFIGIWIWAWQGRHRQVFTRMAQLPMEDDVDADDASSSTAGTQGDHR
ncbi:MAG: cbb3-type cytochrome c oxidase subunit 3 [Rhodanobacter sp.]|nr:MAG: cbb3-type cytochrome c oxidase subunit 3 [Rhodanobacter sp.]